METSRLSTDMSLLYEEDFQSMKVSELRQALKTRNLPTTGTKAELVNRLIEATSSSKDALLETDADTNEDEILDDDISPDSPTKELSLFAEEKLSPEVPLLETKAARKRVAITMGNGQEKKLCLNRATPIDVPPASVEEDIVVHKKTTIDAGDLTAKKIVFSDKELTAHEKLALRAERFNVKSSGTIKLKVTDKGNEKLPSPDTKAANFKPITFGSAPNLDKLKMRAERFGVVSSLLQKIEEKDRAKQRLVRFGASATASSGTDQTNLSKSKFDIRHKDFDSSPPKLESKKTPVLNTCRERASKFKFISPELQHNVSKSKFDIRHRDFYSLPPKFDSKKTVVFNTWRERASKFKFISAKLQCIDSKKVEIRQKRFSASPVPILDLNRTLKLPV